MTEDATRRTASANGDGSAGGYVHDPSEFGDGNDADRDDGADRGDAGPRTTRAYHPEVPTSATFGAKGWALVAALFVAFVAIPGFILYIPYSGGFLESLGLTWRDAYLTLPLVPAILLAALAVWVAMSD